MFVFIGLAKNSSEKEAIHTDEVSSDSEMISTLNNTVKFEEYVAQDEVFEAYVPLMAIENLNKKLNFDEQVNNNQL